MRLDQLPTAGTVTVDWDDHDRDLAWVRELRGCDQDPVWHAEGDVWRHTRMVLEALVEGEWWRSAEPGARRRLYAAALLHDVAKPAVTRIEDGRIRSRGHSRLGAIMARGILWRSGVDAVEREQVCRLVGSHQVPFFAIDRADADRVVITLSQTLRCRDLAALAEADARGRHCTDGQDLLDRVELFRELARELGCLDQPYRFPDEATRYHYLRDERRSRWDRGHPPGGSTMVILSGLPGAGKDHWARTVGDGLAVVSFDVLRRSGDRSLADNPGRLLQAVREEARRHLRAERDFVISATNLTHRRRDPWIALGANYDAAVRIVAVEASEVEILERNRRRNDAERVPAEVITKMVRGWERPEPELWWQGER